MKIPLLLCLALGMPALQAAGDTSSSPGLLPARVLAQPALWYAFGAPSKLTPNLQAEAEAAKGTPARPCQTLTKQDGGYASAAWTGLNVPLPANRLLHVPVYLDDFQAAGGFSLSLTIELSNAKGAIRYNFSSNAFKAAGWSYLPLWDPSTPANAVFSKPGSSVVMSHSGFDFAEPVTSISVVPNNLPAGARISLGPIETATKTKPLIVVTNDITDNSTYTEIVPTMEAAGFRGGLRIGGFKESSYSGGNVEKLRAAYGNGWDVYNGSWSRLGLGGSTTREQFENEIAECKKRAEALGFTRGMTWFSTAGNSLPPQTLAKSVAAAQGVRVLKGGGGLGLVNIIRADGLGNPAIVTCIGMGGRRQHQATGVRGESVITIPSPVAFREGSAVSGEGIGEGARIAPNGVSGNKVKLTVPNSGDVTGPVTISDSLEAHLAIADGLLYTGGVLVYFLHDLKPAGAEPSLISFPADDFAKLVAYWKTKCASGLLEIVTPSQFDAIMAGER